mgnify:CR=1 FL=1
MTHVKDFYIPDLPDDVIVMFPEEFYSDYYRNIETISSLQERVPFCYSDDFDKMFLVKKDENGKIIASLTIKVFPNDGYFRNEEIASMTAIGVDQNYRNLGHAKDLIDCYFKIIENNNIAPSHSHWEPDGKKYLEDYWYNVKNSTTFNKLIM